VVLCDGVFATTEGKRPRLVRHTERYRVCLIDQKPGRRDAGRCSTDPGGRPTGRLDEAIGSPIGTRRLALTFGVAPTAGSSRRAAIVDAVRGPIGRTADRLVQPPIGSPRIRRDSPRAAARLLSMTPGPDTLRVADRRVAVFPRSSRRSVAQHHRGSVAERGFQVTATVSKVDARAACVLDDLSRLAPKIPACHGFNTGRAACRQTTTPDEDKGVRIRSSRP